MADLARSKHILKSQQHLKSNLFDTYMPLFLIVLPIILLFLYVYKFGVDIPFWDEWQMVSLLQLFRGEGAWLPAIWQHDNMHKQFFSRLIILYMSDITSWNIVAEMYVNALLITIWTGISWLLYRKVTNGGLWGFVPVAWLLCSWGQWENILWGWQITLFLMIVSLTGAIYLLSTNYLRSFFLALISGIVASYSFANGLLVWPIGLVMLLVMHSSRQKIVLWLVTSVVTVTVFFMGFDPSTVKSPVEAVTYSVIQISAFFLANAGTPLSGGHLLFSGISGILLLLFMYYLLISRLQTLHWQIADLDVNDAVILALFIFSIGSSLLITAGRIGYDQIGWANSSRYATSISMGILGIYLGLYRRNQSQQASRLAHILLAGFLVLLFTGLAMAYSYGWRQGKIRHIRMQQMQFALYHREYIADDVLGILSISPKSLRKAADYLEAEQLSVFSKAPNLLLHTIIGEGIPFDEILPERPLIQQFPCPVDTLYDFAVLFATYDRQNDALYQLSLLRDEKTVWSTEFSADKLVEDNKLHYFQLDDPITNCYHDSLILKIETKNAIPGNAITVWTYPVFYEATFINPHKSTLENKVLALEMNTCHYNLKNCEYDFLK